MEAARWIIVFVAAVTAAGGLSADWFVPFGVGFGQGVLAIGLLFVAPLSLGTIMLAALIASLYWDTIMVAPIFPGTAWVDREFDEATPRPLGLPPQQLIGYVLLGLLVVAVALAFMSG